MFHLQAALERLPHWDDGRNHIVFTTSDFERPPVGREIRAHAGMSLAEYRPCQDVTFPTFNIRNVRPLLPRPAVFHIAAFTPPPLYCGPSAADSSPPHPCLQLPLPAALSAKFGGLVNTRVFLCLQR